GRRGGGTGEGGGGEGGVGGGEGRVQQGHVHARDHVRAASRSDAAAAMVVRHPGVEGEMKITEVRTRTVRWKGKTTPLPPHFCTNPMDLLARSAASMGTFTFHGWLIVEIFTDAGHVGIGNAALAPPVTKQVIDLYLKPLLIGADPWDVEQLWQHMYRSTMA